MEGSVVALEMMILVLLDVELGEELKEKNEGIAN